MPTAKMLWRWTLCLGVAWLGCAGDEGAGQPNPQMRAVLDAHRALGARAPYEGSLEEARAGVTARDAVEMVLRESGRSVEPDRMAAVWELLIPGPGGALRARVYVPAGEGPMPLVVYLHDGGFVLGGLDDYDASARAISNQAGAIVVSVQTRLAPEHPYPAPLDDAVAAFRFVVANAPAFDGDPARVAIAGEGSGANLATAATMRFLREGGALPRFQLLIYPFLSNDLTTPSHALAEEHPYFLRNQDLAWYWRLYLEPGWRELADPEALPIHAGVEALRGMPPALVITAELDPLADEGQAYARMLAAAGVPTEALHVPGVTHEFFGMGAVLDEARAAQVDAGLALKAAFATAR